MPPAAKAYLVGAGPGDPGLLTLRGRQLLGEADVVLYDYLVNPRILDAARADAELVCLGRHGSGRIVTQDEINEQMIAAARAGRAVVRLKGGDPAIFGRAAEEIAALEAARRAVRGRPRRHRGAGREQLRRHSFDASQRCVVRRLCHRAGVPRQAGPVA